MIDAFSDAETLAATSAGELQEVYAQVQAAYDAYEALTDEQKPQITGAEILKASLPCSTAWQTRWNRRGF